MNRQTYTRRTEHHTRRARARFWSEARGVMAFSAAIVFAVGTVPAYFALRIALGH